MNRKKFLKKSALLLAGLGTSNILHPSILKALAIDPPARSTFYDAEHVVILMQENRAFDHYFGTMFVTLRQGGDAGYLISRKKIVLKDDYISQVVDIYHL